MNKFLTKLVNNDKLSMGVVGAGLAMSIVSNVIVFVGVYYTALHKGVELREEYYYQEEVRRYEENQTNS